ncbi:MAG: substrate-binding domain-containing protein [Oscillospiraceae bacterium]|nr:substrate-binding domain-containing protein [Oscillospiraceae bacterium]
MKKILAITLVIVFTLALVAGCTNNNTPSSSSPSQSSSSPSPSNTSPSPANTNQTPESTEADDSFDASRIIAVFTREDGSGTRDAFVSITGVGGDMYEEAVVISETNEILTKVEENEYAISYVSVGSLSDRVKALTIDGVYPSNETIMDGSYKLQRPLLVCVNADSVDDPLVQDFIAFMLSAEGQDIAATRWTKVDLNAESYSTSGLSGTLKVGGSTSVEPLMQALRQAYIVLNPGVEIEISGGGSGAGISESTSGVLDIGMSSRALRDEEKANLTDYDIALDGVAVIVNPANPVEGMTIDQVKVIFTGEVTRWADSN